jgi:putative DNA primase/helicase
LAEELMKDFHFITMKDNDVVYVYIDGFYQPYGEILVKQQCKIRLGAEYRKNRVSEVLDYIKASTYTDRREEPAHLVPLANGILNLKTMELQPYKPDYMFFNKLPVKYDPDAGCPQIKKFLMDITATKEDIDILLEVIGFCLYREYFIAKALMLVGGGSNGKSTFLNLVKAFLGRENVSSRSLQDLEEHRFSKADLHHKLANIYADLPDKALFRTGTFKMLTGRDLITAERKFQHSFMFENYAKLLFSANKVPEAYDDTDAFFRRWLIVVFPNQFIGDKADPYILEKLTTPEELSGLLNLVLEALKRLLERGRFSHSKTTEEIREDYIRKSSPIAAFVLDCLEVDSDAFIIKQELFNTFAAYCRERGIPCVTKDTFFKNLPRHVAVTDERPKIEGKRPTTFKGIRYNEGVSTLSNVSRVFYTLIEKTNTLDLEKWDVERLDNDGLAKVTIKIGKTLDRLDTLDTETVGEKLKQLKTWLIDHRDKDGLVDSTALSSKIKELGLDIKRTIQLLIDEYWLREVPAVGKFGVK